MAAILAFVHVGQVLLASRWLTRLMWSGRRTLTNAATLVTVDYKRRRSFVAEMTSMGNSQERLVGGKTASVQPVSTRFVHQQRLLTMCAAVTMVIFLGLYRVSLLDKMTFHPPKRQFARTAQVIEAIARGTTTLHIPVDSITILDSQTNSSKPTSVALVDALRQATAREVKSPPAQEIVRAVADGAAVFLANYDLLEYQRGDERMCNVATFPADLFPAFTLFVLVFRRGTHNFTRIADVVVRNFEPFRRIRGRYTEESSASECEKETQFVLDTVRPLSMVLMAGAFACLVVGLFVAVVVIVYERWSYKMHRRPTIRRALALLAATNTKQTALESVAHKH